MANSHKIPDKISKILEFFKELISYQAIYISIALILFILIFKKSFRFKKTPKFTSKQNSSLIPPNLHYPERDFFGAELRGQSFAGKNLSYANFQNAILKGCDFSDCDLSFANFTGADLYRAKFENSCLYATSLRETDLTRADFTNARFYGVKMFNTDVTRCKFDRIIYEEKIAKSREDYIRASDVYNTLKRSLKDHGEIEQAANYYYRQRVCQRKSKNILFRGFQLIFLDWLIGYGEKPIRGLFCILLTIIGFGFTFISLPHLGLGSIIDKSSGESVIINSFNQFFSALEFSITSFSGANLSDWDVKGSARLLMSLEGLIGIILTSITLIGFTRKLVRD